MTAITTTTSHTSPTRYWRWLIIGTICFVALAAGIWATAAILSDDTPRLNDNAVVLTKFIGSRQFEELPFDQQRQFYKVLDDRDEELDHAYASKRLTESEYRTGLEAAWLGKHINRVEKYYSLPPGQARTSYVAKLLEKKERKKAKAKDNPDGIDADETAAELRVEKWPSAVRTQWQTFHDIYRAQRKSLEESRPPQTKPSI
jgi:hypothetical protein